MWVPLRIRLPCSSFRFVVSELSAGPYPRRSRAEVANPPSSEDAIAIIIHRKSRSGSLFANANGHPSQFGDGPATSRGTDAFGPGSNPHRAARLFGSAGEMVKAAASPRGIFWIEARAGAVLPILIKATVIAADPPSVSCLIAPNECAAFSIQDRLEAGRLAAGKALRLLLFG